MSLAVPSGADLLARCREREGGECVFGVPGDETLDLNNALADSRIRFISTRHEQGAAFMADANLDRARVRVPLNCQPLHPKFAVPAHGDRH